MLTKLDLDIATIDAFTENRHVGIIEAWNRIKEEIKKSQNNKIDYRKISLDNLPYRLAIEDIGVYPMAVEGGKNSYKKRTERMEGHNEAIMQVHEKACQISEFLEKCSCRIEVEDALLKEDIFIIAHKDEPIKLFVNCNDVFYWACSDCEEIKPEEIKELTECIELSKNYGTMLWCCRKRKMRPQHPWYERFSDEEKKLFDVCGTERDPKDEG